MNIREYRAEYEELGFDTLPLRARTKTPLVKGWNYLESSQMWENAPEDVNIGIRTGGVFGLAVIDCDDDNQLDTFSNIQEWLTTLNYLPEDYPVVQSASGTGRHIYISVTPGLDGNFCNLSSDFGVGSFRFGQGAYVAAPPSVIAEGGTYELIEGDFRQLPIVRRQDVLPIIEYKEWLLNSVHQKIPKRARELLDGKHLEDYLSRSEAEQAIITYLINAGYTFDSILNLFVTNPCAGKFNELMSISEKGAIRYLRHSYDSAYHWAASHESKPRQIAKAALAMAEAESWPGRTGIYDKEVFRSHAEIAYRAGRTRYSASARDIALRAECSPPTAMAATRRLSELGLLTLVCPYTDESPNVYMLNESKLLHFLTPPYEEVLNNAEIPDIFRYQGLGKSAGEVYRVLLAKPATEKQLVVNTGRHIDTVRRALRRMANLRDTVTGEILPMVKKEDEVWFAIEVDYNHIAEILKVSGMGARKKEQYANERRLHHKSLEAGKRSKNSGQTMPSTSLHI